MPMMTQEPAPVETDPVETTESAPANPAPTGRLARFRAFAKRHPVLTAVLIAL